MRGKLLIITFFFIVLSACYDSKEDLTEIRKFNFERIILNDSLLADGFSVYSFLVEIPGIRFGESKEVKLATDWGSWIGGTDSLTIPVKYNSDVDSYIDTVFLKAGREVGLFTIQVNEGVEDLGRYDFETFAQFPTSVQILSDSLRLKLNPGSTTGLKIFFSSDKGFPSKDIRFSLTTLDSVNIFPQDIFIDSTEVASTLQLTNESNIGKIKVFGVFPELSGSENYKLDTLKIEIIN
jgi:hypothetical protein